MRAKTNPSQTQEVSFKDQSSKPKSPIFATKYELKASIKNYEAPFITHLDTPPYHHNLRPTRQAMKPAPINIAVACTGYVGLIKVIADQADIVIG